MPNEIACPPVARKLWAPTSGPRGIVVPATQDIRTTIHTLHSRYLLNLLRGLPRYLEYISKEGLVSCRPGFPDPGPDLVERFDFEAYPHFALFDFKVTDPSKKEPVCLTLPFRIGDSIYLAKELKPAAGLPAWGGKEICCYLLGQRRIQYHESGDFESERQKRLTAAYARSKGGAASLSESNPGFVRWLAGKIGGRGEILSIGCGYGRIEQELAAYPENHVLGIELQPETAESARQRGIEVLTGDSNHLLDLLSASNKIKKFKVVLVSESIGYFYLSPFLGQVKEVLAEDGELMLITTLPINPSNPLPSPHYFCPDWPGFKALLERQGFSVEELLFIKCRYSEHKGICHAEFLGTTDDPRQASFMFVRASAR